MTKYAWPGSQQWLAWDAWELDLKPSWAPSAKYVGGWARARISWAVVVQGVPREHLQATDKAKYDMFGAGGGQGGAGNRAGFERIEPLSGAKRLLGVD